MSEQRQQVPEGLDLRTLLEDAYQYRDTLVDGYWCDRCDQATPQRCAECQRDAEMRAAYQRALDTLGDAS
jgi:hypothetical protein